MTAIRGGIWPAVLTPYRDDDTPCLQTLDQMVELFIEQKLGGLYILGSTGQGPALPAEHRRIVAQHVIRAARGRIPVMVHVGSIVVKEAQDLARHAADCGADAVSSVPPIYFPADAEVIFEHYRQIALAAKLPFYPYHLGSAMQGLPGAAEYARRLLELPHFQGMKYTDLDMYYLLKLRRHLGDKPIIFSGADELMCHGTLSGSNGGIGSFYNLFGPEFRTVNERFRAGDWQIGRRLMDAFAGLADRLLSRKATFTNFVREAMKYRYSINIGPGHTAMDLFPNQWTEAEIRGLVDGIVEAVGCESCAR